MVRLKRTLLLCSACCAAAVLLAAGPIRTVAHADESGDLARVKQELAVTKESLANFKSLYEKKEREIKDLNGKIGKLQGTFDTYQGAGCKGLRTGHH